MVSRIKWLDGGNLVCATGADCVRAALDWSPLSALRGGDLWKISLFFVLETSTLDNTPGRLHGTQSWRPRFAQEFQKRARRLLGVEHAILRPQIFSLQALNKDNKYRIITIILLISCSNCFCLFILCLSSTYFWFELTTLYLQYSWILFKNIWKYLEISSMYFSSFSSFFRLGPLCVLQWYGDFLAHTRGQEQGAQNLQDPNYERWKCLLARNNCKHIQLLQSIVPAKDSSCKG